jgi:hypothetical protein
MGGIVVGCFGFVSLHLIRVILVFFMLFAFLFNSVATFGFVFDSVLSRVCFHVLAL